MRRGSRRKGTCEAGFWRRNDQRELQQVLLAARRYELVERPKGRRNGPLGHVALEALALLIHVIDLRTGRLEPSYDYLMLRLRRSRDAVTRALEALREHGFLDWIRRYESNGVTEGPGPRIRQATNAYRLSLPARAGRLLGRWLNPLPRPDDVVQMEAERAAEVTAQKAALPLSELPLVEIEDDRLGRLLGEMGRAVAARAAKQCESARQEESLSESFQEGSTKG